MRRRWPWALPLVAVVVATYLLFPFTCWQADVNGPGPTEGCDSRPFAFTGATAQAKLFGLWLGVTTLATILSSLLAGRLAGPRRGRRIDEGGGV